jgi:hypothetical protein
VSLIPGTSDYSPGFVRVSFLVVDPRGRVISRPQARVWVARSLHDRPFVQTLARLEPIGVPGVSTGADAKAIYVAHVRVPAAGKYQLVARPLGGKAHIAALGDLRRAAPLGPRRRSVRARIRRARRRSRAATAASAS